MICVASHGCMPCLFFFKQKTAYEIGLGIPAEPLFRSFPRLCAKCLLNLSTNLASHFFDLVIGKILTSRLSLSKHLAHNLGNLLLLGKIGVFHNRRNASSRLLLLISKHLIDRKSGSAGMPRPISYDVTCPAIPYTLSLHDALPIFNLSTNLASHFFDLVIGKILTSRLSLSKHLAHNLGNLLLLGKIGVFHNRRNASSRLLLLISKHLILCIYLVFRILA